MWGEIAIINSGICENLQISVHAPDADLAGIYGLGMPVGKFHDQCAVIGYIQRFSVADKQVVKLQTFTSRPVIFEDVPVRVREDFATYAHLDYDEANACGFAPGSLGRILP